MDTGDGNTGVGTLALPITTSGSDNTAIGNNAMGRNSTGNYNTGVGSKSLNTQTSASGNVAIGYEAGFSTTGSHNIFIGHQAGYNASVSHKLYIDNSNTATPLIYGDFFTNALTINGTLETTGNIIPEAHKSDDLGQSGLAWNDVYADDLVNEGTAAFEDRSVVEELILHQPKAKTKGMFDYKTDKGLVELDPASLPSALTQGKGILIDEMASYNYKANYEQQLLINELKQMIGEFKNTIEGLNERIEDLEKR